MIFPGALPTWFFIQAAAPCITSLSFALLYYHNNLYLSTKKCDFLKDNDVLEQRERRINHGLRGLLNHRALGHKI
jgi:hypothetical protein